MHELYKEPSGEKQELSEEQEEQAKYWLGKYLGEEVASEDRRECGPEVAELEELLASFEATHNLEELHSITNLTSEEALEHLPRQAAKRDLIPIVEILNKLKEETNISSEDNEVLKEKYKRLSQAVGIINNNKVDHTR